MRNLFWLVLTVITFGLVRRPRPDHTAEINRLLRQGISQNFVVLPEAPLPVQEVEPLPSGLLPPPQRVEQPDYREVLQEAWQQTAADEQSRQLFFDRNGGSTCQPLEHARQNSPCELRIATWLYPGLVRHDPSKCRHTESYRWPPCEPGTCGKLLEKLAAAIQERDRPLTFKVFVTPQSTQRLPEPDKVQQLYADCLRSSALTVSS